MSAIQTEYFLLSREEAEVMRPNTRDLAVSFVPFSPLGQGFLTGYVRNLEDLKGDRRAGHPRYREASFAHNRALVDLVEAIACEKKLHAGPIGPQPSFWHRATMCSPFPPPNGPNG